MLLLVYLQHHYLHHVSHGHGLRGVLDEAVADLGNMHQPVLMDADSFIKSDRKQSSFEKVAMILVILERIIMIIVFVGDALSNGS